MANEATVRNYLREQCKALGWRSLPLVDVGKRAWLDRTIIGLGGRVAFAEVKADGYKHDPKHLSRQAQRRKELQDMGHIAVQIIGRHGVAQFIYRLITVERWPFKPTVEAKGSLEIQNRGPTKDATFKIVGREQQWPNIEPTARKEP